jgi:hypothetical protein
MFLTALALSAAIQADRWIHVGRSPDGHEEYLDKESVRRSGDKVHLWTRRDLAGGQGTAWNEIELDCAARTDTILAWVRDDRGTVSHNVERPHRGPAPIPPNSVAERIFEIACR